MIFRGLHFSDPYYLLLLLALVPIIGFLFFTHNTLIQRLQKILSLEQIYKKELITSSSKALTTPMILFLLALALFVLALARPQANPTEMEEEIHVLDIMILLDTSKSMATEDIYPNRLEKARHAISTLIDNVKGDRIGLIAFAGDAVLVFPLTTDHSILKNTLKSIDTDTIGRQGTNLELAITTAMNAFLRGSIEKIGESETFYIVIFTDGENTTGKAITSVEKAYKNGVISNIVSIGTDKGAPIPIRDRNGFLISYKKNKSGGTVISKVDTKELSRLAKKGGGNLYRATTQESEIRSLVKSMSSLGRIDGKTAKFMVYEEYFVIPLSLGILLLLISFVPVHVWKTIIRWRGRSLIPFLLIVGMMGVSDSAYSNENTEGEQQEGQQESQSILDMPQDFKEEERLVKIPTLFLYPPPKSTLFLNEEGKKSFSAIEKYKEGEYQRSMELFNELLVDDHRSPDLIYNSGTSMIASGEHEKGRSLLRLLEKATIQSMGEFNEAGSYGLEKNRGRAILGYADVVEKLSEKKELSKEESIILEQARKNLEILVMEQKKQNKKSQKKNDGKGKNKDKDGNKGDKKDEKNKNYMGKRKKFKENEQVSEENAARILKELSYQESLLKKKLLRRRTRNKRQQSRPVKDW